MFKILIFVIASLYFKVTLPIDSLPAANYVFACALDDPILGSVTDVLCLIIVQIKGCDLLVISEELTSFSAFSVEVFSHSLSTCLVHHLADIA